MTSKLDVSIPAEGGIFLHGWLFVPDGKGLFPAVTMAHGFGGSIHHGLEPFAVSFAEAGSRPSTRSLRSIRRRLSSATVRSIPITARATSKRRASTSASLMKSAARAKLPGSFMIGCSPYIPIGSILARFGAVLMQQGVMDEVDDEDSKARRVT